MDFVGKEKVILREGAAGYPLAFIFAACSAADKNDAALPFGTTISSADLKVFDSQGMDITTAASGTTSVAGGGLQVNTTLKYPAAASEGPCEVLVLLTLSSGAVLPKRWDGLWIE